MGEFGHFGSIGGGVCLDCWGAGPFVIEAGGQSYRFEDSDRFGPLIILKNGSQAARQSGEHSPFWKVYLAWRKQGRRVEDDDVTCIHDPLKPTLYRKVGRRKGGWEIVIVEHGDEDGGYVEVQQRLAKFVERG